MRMVIRRLAFAAILMALLIISMPVSFALAISNVTKTAEHDSAAIRWLTDDASSGMVDYGLTKSLGLSSNQQGFLTQHEVNLLNLVDGRKYYFQVKSVNASGFEKTDNNNGNYYEFTTKDSTAPDRVTGLKDNGRGLDYINLKWDNTKALDFLKYLVYRDDINIANSTLAEYADSGLAPDTAYRYKVSAVDISGNIGMQSSIVELRTLVPDYKQPEMSDVKIAELHENSARVSWLTDEPAGSAVYYGLNANVEKKAEKNESVTEHLIEMNELLNNTPYYYKVVSCDASSNCAESTIQNFRTGEDTEPPAIDVELPEWHNSNRLDIEGKTEPFSKVRVYVNNQLKRAVNTESSGSFKFSGVSLDTNMGSNMVRIVAIDQVGFESSVEKEIRLDTEPPVLDVTKLDMYTHETNIVLEGTVNEEAEIDINVVQGDKKVEVPLKVTGLKLIRQEGNSAEIQWDELEDIEGYIIYRNGKKITTYTDNSFIDPALTKSKQYTYEVSAYNSECTEGSKSAPLAISTPANISEVSDEADEISDYCSVYDSGYGKMTVSGKFSQNVELFEGKNLVIVTATDKAGNKAAIEQETIVDSERPEILDTNIGSLSPSYIKHVTINGEVSKKPGQKVIVTVTVNGDNSYSGIAEEDGTFSIGVDLEREVYDELDERTDYDPERRSSNYYAEFGNAWDNKITVVARSESGLASEPYEDYITLATCGYGSWWSIELGKPTPEILTPRLMLEGLAQIGIPVTNIKWQGGIPNGSLNYVDIRPAELSERDTDRYDLDWVQNIEYITNQANPTKGYVLITIRKLDSGSLFMDSEEAKDGKSEDELTTLEMENYLSEHRLEEKDCIVPGFGCLRVPLMMELDFFYVDSNKSNIYLSRNSQEIEQTKQKQCWDVEISIDRRLPSDKIPEEFLKSSINLLNSTIEAINQILKPLNTIKEVTFYGCAGTMLMDFAMAFQESFNCEFSETLNVFTESTGENGEKIDKWNVYDAQTGQCEEKYEDEQKDACLQCEEAIRARKNFEKAMRWVCDRIFCPSAPTLQKYVGDMSDQYRGGDFWNAKDGEQVLRSDCAFEVAEGKDKKINYDDVKKIYGNYEDELKAEKEQEDGSECSGLHIPNEKCCGSEYMEQWDSACLFMNELKESKCIALDDMPSQSGGGEIVNTDPDCGSGRKIWNSLAGFCEPDGAAPAEIVRTGDTFKRGAAYAPTTNFTAGQTDNDVWFRFLPKDYQANRPEAKGRLYYAEIGRVTSDIKSAVPNWKQGEVSRVATERVFKPEKAAMFAVDVTTMNKDTSDYNTVTRDAFVKQYTAIANPDKKNAERVYEYLQETIGVSDKEYVVDPTSGFLRSVQCACLPGITSYLNLWKKVLEAVKVCFETVLVTGDGSAGICKAVLSVYVCDLIYDLISCFTNKYGAGYKREYSGGIGNFFGALTSAGNKVSSSITTRYGDSTIWKSLFAERKLVHAACLWAFTGTWDFDVSSVLEEDVSIDVNTVAFLYPCTRRFVSFDPSASPPGITTYNYHVALGMVAGSKMNYRVQLVCSDGLGCDTPTGECDCLGHGKQTRDIVMGPGTASRGDVIEEEEYYNLMDKYRYDKAIVSWTSDDSDKNGEMVCKIRDVGGEPPAFCSLDIAEGAYRCELGFDEENYIRFYNEPTLDKAEYYAEDGTNPPDKISVNLRLVQRQPKSAVEKYSGKEINPYTKFMFMRLYRGNTLLIESGPYNFNGNGMHEINNLPNFEVRKEYFSMGESSFIVDPSNLVRSRGFQGKTSGPTSTEYYDVYITFKDEKSFEVTKETIGTDGKKVTVQLTGVSSTDYRIKPGNFIFFDNYYIELNQQPKNGTKLHIKYTPSNDASAGCTDKQERWKLDIVFYDKEADNSDPSGQKSMYMGAPVQKSISVPVRCRKPSSMQLPPCPYKGGVTAKCRCGTVDCEPGKDGKTTYCNYNNDIGSCDEELKP